MLRECFSRIENPKQTNNLGYYTPNTTGQNTFTEMPAACESMESLHPK